MLCSKIGGTTITLEVYKEKQGRAFYNVRTC